MPSPSGVFDGTINLLQKSLNVRSVQHQVLSSNVANADTPNYKAFEVAVDEELRKLETGKPRIQLARTQSSHLPLGRAETDRVFGPTQPIDVVPNFVDLERFRPAADQAVIKQVFCRIASLQLGNACIMRLMR